MKVNTQTPMRVAGCSRAHVSRQAILTVHSIWLTIQGEGPYAGRPAVFVRLIGCNLQCPACDTEYTSNPRPMTTGEIVSEVKGYFTKRLLLNSPLVVITGGEPFRQDIYDLCLALSVEGIGTQIETNGTLSHLACVSTHLASTGASKAEWEEVLESRNSSWLHLVERNWVTIICSPKAPKINPELLPLIWGYKYVLEDGYVDPADGLPTRILLGMPPARPPASPRRLVYVQPLDEQDEERNKLHEAAALASAMEFGYTLCLQLHKMLGLQ